MRGIVKEAVGLPTSATHAVGTAPCDHREVLGRTAWGAFLFGGGQVLLLVAGAVGGVFLARLLNPSDFGVYAVTSFFVVKVSALAELGLGTNLIHDQDPVSRRRLQSLFALHCLTASAVYVAVYAAAPALARLFRLSDGSGEFIRLVGLIIILQPLASMPAALLGRELRYDRIAPVDVATGCVYQALAVALAAYGLSYWSFGLAALAAHSVRALSLNVVRPWRLGFAWDAAYLRRCLQFGGAFQLSSLTAVARDNIITLLGGPLFGPNVVGLLNWADRLAWMCSQTYVGICSKVAFPTLSRMRADAVLFAATLTRMLRYMNLATFLTLSVVTGLAPEIVRLVFTEKWLPAIPFFYCMAIRMIAGNYTTLLDLGLKAQGRPERSLMILSLWTAWEWALALAGVALFGVAGIPIAYATGIWLALAWLYLELSHSVRLDLARATTTPALCGVVTVVALTVLKAQRIHSLFELALAGVAGAVLFAITGLLAEGGHFLRQMRSDLSLLRAGAPAPTALAVGSRR